MVRPVYVFISEAEALVPYKLLRPQKIVVGGQGPSQLCGENLLVDVIV